MDHGGEVARPMMVESTDLDMARAVQGGEAHMTSGTFHAQVAAAAARRAGFQPSAAAYYNSAEFVRHVRAASGDAVPVALFHREPGPGGAYANIGVSWRQLPPVDVLLVGVDPQLPGGVVPVHVDYGYSALQFRPGGGRAVVLVDLLHGGARAVYNGADYALQPLPDAGHGEVLADMLPDGAGVVYSNYMNPSPAAGHGEVFVGLVPDGAGHGEAFVGQLRGGGLAAYDDYVYYALQLRPGAGHGEVLVDQLPNGAGHGEVYVGLLRGGGGAVHDDYGYYPWQPCPGVGSGEVFIGPLPNGDGAVFLNSGSFAQQTLLGTGRADGMAGALRVPNLGVGYGGSTALADDLGAMYEYDNHDMVAEHLRRLLPFVGISASAVAVNELAAGPGSPAVAFHLFVLLLGGLFLVILHVLRV